MKKRNIQEKMEKKIIKEENTMTNTEVDVESNAERPGLGYEIIGGDDE